MKAIVQHQYGSTDTLQLSEIPIPVPGENEVVIRVKAAGLHIGDWHVMTGLPYMLRVVGFGLRAPKVTVRGMDVAGTVEEVGSAVTEFRRGDEVFGTCEGAFAEFAVAPVANLALKPATVTFEQAAAVPTSSFAALQALRDRGDVQSGQSVLIVGAAGAVGAVAVQLAKSFGATVTAVCSAGKADWVRSLGADRVIDYGREDFAAGTARYDVILDIGGSRSLADLRRALKPMGTLVLIGGEGGNRVLGGTDKWLHALAVSPFVQQKLRPLSTKPNKADLLLLKGYLEKGALVPRIDRTFTLAQVPDALLYMKSGLGTGKVVIRV